MTLLVLAIAGFVAWLISTIGAGGGGLLLLPVVAYLLGPKAVAPTLALGALFSGPARIFIFWRNIEWTIVRWYLPGAIGGAIAGGWIFSRMEAEWLKIVIGLFLISTIFQFQLGRRERSFSMRISFFAPLGFLVALVSAIIGEAGPVLNPFYLNAGVDKERLIGTKSFNSFVMQLTKISSYTFFGVMQVEFLAYGLTIGIAATLASGVGRRLLGRMPAVRFRQFVIALMVITGAWMLWENLPAF